ncbi:hypothetical protein [Sulfurospirillum arcachonense]|nr:hypothetical protein [Sulfurospirillum arcachonense]
MLGSITNTQQVVWGALFTDETDEVYISDLLDSLLNTNSDMVT